MTKTKLIIPQKGIYQVFRNQLQFDPVLKHETGKQLTNFTNPNATYVMNIDKKVNSINYHSESFLHDLNIPGDLEINMDCNVNYGGLSLHLSDGSEFSQPSWVKFKELTLNTTPGHTIDFDISEDNELDPKHRTIEKINIKADEITGRFEDVEKLKELTLDCNELGRMFIYCPNLQKINFPSMKKFNIPSSYKDYYANSSGWNIYDRSPRNYDDEEMKPHCVSDSCLITLPKDCIFETGIKLDTGYDKLAVESKVKDKTMGQIFNENTAGSYIDNGKTFSVKFQDFKALLAAEIIKKFDSIVTDAKHSNKTQQEINMTQFKSKKSTKNKIR